MPAKDGRTCRVKAVRNLWTTYQTPDATYSNNSFFYSKQCIGQSFVYWDGVTNKYVHKEVLHQSNIVQSSVDAFREHRPSWQRKPKAQQHGWSNRTRCLKKVGWIYALVRVAIQFCHSNTTSFDRYIPYQEMSLTKLGFNEIPALASKMLERASPMKSVETTSSSV